MAGVVAVGRSRGPALAWGCDPEGDRAADAMWWMLADGDTEAVAVGRSRGPARRLFPGLQTFKNIQHRLRNIRVVMDDLPAAGLTAIDVRDAMLDCDPLSGKTELPALNTHFVGQVPCDLKYLIIQLYPPR